LLLFIIIIIGRLIITSIASIYLSFRVTSSSVQCLVLVKRRSGWSSPTPFYHPFYTTQHTHSPLTLALERNERSTSRPVGE
jgi:hypothetical protein